MLHTSSVEISLAVPEKKMFEGFLPYMFDGHLGHVTEGLGRSNCPFIKKKNIYGLGVGILMVSELLHIL